MTSKTKSKPKAKAAPVQAKPAEGYAGHKVGSRKGMIHQLHDREGVEVAWTRGLKMGLKENTLRTWFGTWARQSKKTTAKKGPTSKKTAATATAHKPEEAAPTAVA